jgi:hypothetical protein
MEEEPRLNAVFIAFPQHMTGLLFEPFGRLIRRRFYGGEKRTSTLDMYSKNAKAKWSLVAIQAVLSVY